MSRTVIVTISMDVLHEMLKLPKSVHIVDIERTPFDRSLGGSVRCRLDSDHFNEVGEGAYFPRANLFLRKEEGQTKRISVLIDGKEVT